MRFRLPSLPFDASALHPFFTRGQIDRHHLVHNDRVIVELNAALQNQNIEVKSLRDLIRQAPSPELFELASDAWNHAFYWHCLTTPRGLVPEGALGKRIDEVYGSFESFKRLFSGRAIDHPGDGWVWLTQDPDGDLRIVATGPRQSPIAEGHLPLLICDLAAHAYAEDFGEARDAYLRSFWPLVNWKRISARYESGVFPRMSQFMATEPLRLGSAVREFGRRIG